jgi:hypothetical protein
MGSHRYWHICGCSRSDDPFFAILIAALLIDQGQAQEGVVILEILEDGVPPRFRLHSETGFRPLHT